MKKLQTIWFTKAEMICKVVAIVYGMNIEEDELVTATFEVEKK